MLPATRSTLLHLRRRLSQVEKGADLLRKKRESLVAELFARARPMMDRRRAIADQALLAYTALLDTLSQNGAAEVTALGWPSRAIEVELELHDVWGLHVARLLKPPIVSRTPAARGSAPGPGDGAYFTAAAELEKFLELLLVEAPEDQLLRRLGESLSRTSRLVRTLEQRVAVDLSRQLAAVRHTLDEREREEHQQLKRRVKRGRRE